MDLWERLDRLVRTGESSLGRLAFTGFVGLGGLGLAALCVRPRFAPVELGQFYAALARDPFAFAPNPVGFRVLTPWLSWALGLRGDAIVWTNLGLAALLLALVYAGFRRRAPRPADALVASTCLALSLVTFSTLFSPGYCDPATYLVVFGMWWWRERPVAFYALFLLGLLNRESIAFLVPWFAWLELQASERRGRSLLRQALGYGGAFALYFGFRTWVAAHGEVGFSLDYYLAPLAHDPLHFYRMTAGRQWLGLYSVFGALWLVPAVTAAAMWRRGDRATPLGIALLLALCWSQLFFAYDTSRLFTLAFPALLVALDDQFRHDDVGLRRWLPWLLGLQFLAPHLRTSQLRIWTMDSTWSAWLRDWLSAG